MRSQGECEIVNHKLALSYAIHAQTQERKVKGYERKEWAFMSSHAHILTFSPYKKMLVDIHHKTIENI